MSFREKSAWICFIGIWVIFAPYFVHVGALVRSDSLDLPSIAWLLSGAIVLQAIVTALAHIVIAVKHRNEKPDERDRAIELRSYRSAYIAVALLAMFIVAVPATWGYLQSPLVIGQLLLLCLIFGEMAKYLIQAIGYRVGL